MAEGYTVPDSAPEMGVKGYQYMLQERRLPDGPWEFVSTNKHNRDIPYPTAYGPMISKVCFEKWRSRYRNSHSDFPEYEYRSVRRPYGEWEVVTNA